MRLARTFFLLIALIMLAGPTPAMALDAGKIVPGFQPAPDAGNIDMPDWRLPVAPLNSGATEKKTLDKFYQKCMLTGGQQLQATDQRALCSCMTAYKERVDSQPKDVYWTNTIKTRAVTPYETFVTRIFAPCMYLEAFSLGARECYRQTHFAVMFPNAKAFDNYCTCYANATEDYVRKYAEPLLAAKMADPTPEEIRHPHDPAQMVMDDIDYRTFIEGERRRCTAIYGYQTSR